MNNKHLAIYYIATSNYKIGFYHFKRNLKYFFPQFKKTVIIISDGLTEWNDVIENDITYKVYHIDHFPWPIITLFKMNYIKEHKIDCDYVCYCNGDMQFNIEYDYSKNNFDFTKLNLSRHSYCNESINLDGHIFAQGIDKNSEAYIDSQYTYVQGGFFFGPSDITYKMCEDISLMVEKDLKKNIIPQWHDESYLNKWRILNNNLVSYPLKKLFAHNVFEKDKLLSCFNTIDKCRYQ